MPIPCPGIVHARGGGGGSDNVGGGGGGNCDGCDGGVMTAKRNKSNQEFYLTFIVFLYIYYSVQCSTCGIHYSLLTTDFRMKKQLSSK
jgi:hypothetical protein